MAWRIEYSKDADKEIAKLDKPIAQRIIRFMGSRVAKLENPRSIGQALAGSTLGDFWKYRVGDYRIIADIQDGKLIVQVVRVGNRREVYR
ncbi:MAG TPA: type II toxin-antitoxin system RelE/ParE family toxin [Terracidiphilus sp.]|jgi:mRNA interferase RelE/StbE|nr:type II toxin-antitoxin system RelE/ParE family toxin [Terracidiphilus sp.]